jgi:hypothetical protein
MESQTSELRELISAMESQTAELKENSAAQLTMHQENMKAAEQVISEIQQVGAAAAEMLSKGAEQDPGSAFTAAAHMTSAKSSVKYARKHWPSRWWDATRDAIRKISTLLWSIIADLVKVKEWSVTGQVDPLFGLAQAGITVTFG